METQQTVENIQWWPTNNIVENWWNMNVMGPDEFKALGEDMKARGPTGIDAIRCCRLSMLKPGALPENQLVVLDGANRLQWAKKYQWPQVKVILDESVKDEAEARAITYTKNSERGSIEPFKEAEDFKWLTEHGQTQEQIAKRRNVDRTYVTHRLALLNVDPQAKAKLVSNPKITVSLVEPITTLPAEQQRELATEIVREAARRDVTVREVEEDVRRTKDKLEKQKKLDEAVAKSNFKTCPAIDEKTKKPCGKKPRVSWKTLPMVECESGTWHHEWSLKTGKTVQEQRKEEQAAERARQKSKPGPKPKPEPPHTIKTSHTLEEFRTVTTNFIKDVVSRMTSIDSAGFEGGFEGKLGDKGVGISLMTDEEGMNLSYTETGKRGSIDDTILPEFDVKAKTWKSEEFKEFRTEVDFNYCRSEKELDQNAKKVMAWFEKYAPKKRGRPPTKKKEGSATK